MTAAKITVTEVSRVKMDSAELVTATGTAASTGDWVLLSDLGLTGPAIFCHAQIDATGVDGEAFRSSTDKVKVTQTGAMLFAILAPSQKSTGGD